MARTGQKDSSTPSESATLSTPALSSMTQGIHQAPSDDVFELQYPLLEKVEDRHLYRIQINSTEQVSKDSSIDPRELSVQLFSVGIR